MEETKIRTVFLFEAEAQRKLFGQREDVRLHHGWPPAERDRQNGIRAQ